MDGMRILSPHATRGWRCSVVLAALLGGVGLVAVPTSAGASAAPNEVVVGVDHLDPANQQPDRGRLFEYTDFFSRDVTVTQGETVDFRFAGFHSIALARSEDAALDADPLAVADGEKGPNGFHKIVFGPSFNPIQGGDVRHPGQGVQPGAQQPSCGLANQPVCTFSGGSDYENSGPIGSQSWTGARLASQRPGRTRPLHRVLHDPPRDEGRRHGRVAIAGIAGDIAVDDRQAQRFSIRRRSTAGSPGRSQGEPSPGGR